MARINLSYRSEATYNFMMLTIPQRNHHYAGIVVVPFNDFISLSSKVNQKMEPMTIRDRARNTLEFILATVQEV